MESHLTNLSYASNTGILSQGLKSQYSLGDVFEKIVDLQQVEVLMEPLFNLPYFTPQEIDIQNKKDLVRAGKFRKHVRFTFEINQLRSIRIPCESSIRHLN